MSTLQKILMNRIVHRRAGLCALFNHCAPFNRRLHVVKRLNCSCQAISPPTADGCEKNYPPKLQNIVDDIAKLTLIEAVDLNELLKKTLNIKDTPMAMATMAVAAAKPMEDEELAPVITKTSFTVKLVAFDPAKKIAVIKEVKKLIEGMNLVLAKKFVDECPQVVKMDIPKDEAEEMKKALEIAGATCEII